eukprot:UN05014
MQMIFAKTLLHDSIAYKFGKDWVNVMNFDKKGQQIELHKLIFVNNNSIQEEEEDNEEEQYNIDDISISLTDDINNLPYNSMIQQFQKDL